MNQILHVLPIATPPARVFSALMTEEGLASWWSTEVTIESGQGRTLVHFTFEGDFNPVMEVIGREEGERLEWRCVAGHDPWLDSTFEFSLATADGGTQLTFRQHYASYPGDEAYGTYNYNWAYYLLSLTEFCETGTGRPYRAD